MEIGSIFEVDAKDLFKEPSHELTDYPFCSSPYSFSYFNTGRAAIESLLHDLKGNGIERIWLPSFNCSSVYDAAKRAGMNVNLYPVGRDLLIDTAFFSEVEKKDIIYLVNFFGKLETETTYSKIKELQKAGITVIEDLTLALLSRNANIGFGNYIIGSIRKWLPITDGGFIASRRELPEYHKADAANDYTLYYFAAQLMKSEYLKDCNLDKQVFLKISNMGMEALFSDYTIRKMSVLSERVIGSTSLQDVAEMRIKNYDMLYDMLSSIPQVRCLIDRKDGMCPLGMILAVDDRDNFFKYLISKGIYCNIHWRPNESSLQYGDSSYLSEHCLTIPCDQRYGEEEMKYIYKTVKDYYHV